MSSPSQLSAVERHLHTLEQWTLQRPPPGQLWQPWIRDLVTRHHHGNILVETLISLLSDPPESCMIPLVMIQWVLHTSPVMLRRQTLSSAVRAVKQLVGLPEPVSSVALSVLAELKTDQACPGHAFATSIAARLGYTSAQTWLSDTQWKDAVSEAYHVLLPPEAGDWADVLLATPPALSPADAALMTAHWLASSEAEHAQVDQSHLDKLFQQAEAALARICRDASIVSSLTSPLQAPLKPPEITSPPPQLLTPPPSPGTPSPVLPPLPPPPQERIRRFVGKKLTSDHLLHRAGASLVLHPYQQWQASLLGAGASTVILLSVDGINSRFLDLWVQAKSKSHGVIEQQVFVLPVKGQSSVLVELIADRDPLYDVRIRASLQRQTEQIEWEKVGSEVAAVLMDARFVNKLTVWEAKLWQVQAEHGAKARVTVVYFVVGGNIKPRESVWVDTSGAAAVGLASSKGRQLHDGPLWLESRSAIHQSEPSQGAFLALVLRGSKQQQVSVP